MSVKMIFIMHKHIFHTSYSKKKRERVLEKKKYLENKFNKKLTKKFTTSTL